ncbi:MAG: endonuclease/exonuclease/phosphatase family protein [Cyclobacteriaceae bacterium]
MKNPLIIILAILAILTVGFILFLFYAQKPNLEKKEDYFRLYRLGFDYTNPIDTLSVTTFNIGYLSGMTNNLPLERSSSLFENNLSNTIDLFKNLKSDIIGLQEIDYMAKRSMNINQSKEIAQALGYAEVYESVNWDKAYLPFPYWPPSQHFGRIISGQSIFSNYKVLDSETITLDKPESKGLFYNSFYIDRLVQVVDLQFGDAVIKVMNLHLEAFEEDARVQQANVVKSLFEKYASEMPVILMGDFNSNAEYLDDNNLAMEIIMSAKNIRSSICHKDYMESPVDFWTYSTGDPEVMIDYILYNENYITCVDARVVQEAGKISDHFPLTAKFILNGKID